MKNKNNINDEFSYEILSDYFENDTHIDLQDKTIHSFHLLPGTTSDDDIIVTKYERSPLLTFYDCNGRIIDVDHYLPDDYVLKDLQSVQTQIENLRDVRINEIKAQEKFKDLLEDIFIEGKGSLIKGLNARFGLSSSSKHEKQFKKKIGFDLDANEYKVFLLSKFKNLYELLESFVSEIQNDKNQYAHITPSGNIIITPLNKKSGHSIIMETKDLNKHLLPINKWIITRTKNEKQLQDALIFRTQDIKDFFNAAVNEATFETSRYKLYIQDNHVTIDSFLDNTDNVVKFELLNNCFQILPSDSDIMVLLTNSKEATIINTHKSVVPSKWPWKVVFNEDLRWLRSDSNVNIFFAQTRIGDIKAFYLHETKPIEIANLGRYQIGFELDQESSIICVEEDSRKPIKIKTNANALISDENQRNFATIFKNLSHLFKGESLFIKTEFARVVTDENAAKRKDNLPTAIEVARYDFETNIAHMLLKAENDYEKLLEVQNKVAVARQNIAEELVGQAEKDEIFLAGQRLQSTLNSILLPTERKIQNILQKIRAQQILEDTQNLNDTISELSDPNEYREILNTVRKYSEELNSMNITNIEKEFNSFVEIKDLLNKVFSDQITTDGTTLQNFIIGELEQVEKAISQIFDPRQLETIISTHPAALELLSLLKQPYVLENIAKERELSPAGIQNRLFKSVEKRKAFLKQELEKKEAEKNAAKLQLAKMIRDNIRFFVNNHSGDFSDLELASNSTHEQIQRDIKKLERTYKDVRLAIELRRTLERQIVEKNKAELERLVTFEGKYAFIQNDPDLYIDLQSKSTSFPKWHLELQTLRGEDDLFSIYFVRDSDKAVYRATTTENLRSGKAFQVSGDNFDAFMQSYENYISPENSYELIRSLWLINKGSNTTADFPQIKPSVLQSKAPSNDIETKALRCALEKKSRDDLEINRQRLVPVISPEFIDDTPFFQKKLNEFIIKAKLQLVSGSGIILLTGPPSTGKSAFLKFVSAIMNREYFEHASDKWQTKNSLVTAIKFGENGPYAIPAGFTKAITTPYSLINIEEIKEWPEALRKSLNPFFAGSKVFIAPDGTQYKIGENILMCAAANLGSMYRQDDEPFTADFWSRIEVVNYDYAPQFVDEDYINLLHNPEKNSFINIKAVVRAFFQYYDAPKGPKEKAKYLAKKFIKFLLLPKADEAIKRDNLSNYINEYFDSEADKIESSLSPEEAVKVALKRIRDLKDFSIKEFFDMYDHFNNDQNLRTPKLELMQSSDIKKYEQMKVLFLCLRYLEGCLRKLRRQFHSSAGETEIEGTNREFIKCIHLLGLIGTL